MEKLKKKKQTKNTVAPQYVVSGLREAGGKGKDHRLVSQQLPDQNTDRCLTNRMLPDEIGQAFPSTLGTFDAARSVTLRCKALGVQKNTLCFPKIYLGVHNFLPEEDVLPQHEWEAGTESGPGWEGLPYCADHLPYFLHIGLMYPPPQLQSTTGFIFQDPQGFQGGLIVGGENQTYWVSSMTIAGLQLK